MTTPPFEGHPPPPCEEGEEWRPYVMVSSHGRVWREGGIVAPKVYDGGYLQYHMMRYVHRMVAETFIGVKQKGLDTSHKDNNKLNNRVDNLEYVTHTKNIQNSSSLNWGIVHHIRRREHTPKEYASMYGISLWTVYDIIRNRCWFDPKYEPSVRNRRSPLGPEKAEEIISEIAAGLPNRATARKCGVSLTTVYNYRRKAKNP